MIKHQSIHDVPQFYKDIPIGLCHIDTDLRFVEINQWLAALNALSASEYLGRTFGEMFPYIADRIEPKIRQVLETSKPISDEMIEVATPDKPDFKRTFKYSCVPVQSEDETVIGVSCVVEEVTKLDDTPIKGEEALRNTEITSRTLLEGSPVCTKIIDLDSRLQYMSAAGRSQLKICDIEPFYGTIFPPELYPESWRAPVTEHLERAKAGETSSLECPVLDTEGRELWYHTTFVPARDEQGQIVYVIATSVDITDRRQAEEALRHSEALLSKAQEIAHIGSFEWNLTRDQIVWSDEMLQIYGISRDDFGGSIADVLPLIHPDDRDRVQEGIERVVKEGTKRNGMEYRIVRPDGSCRTVFGQAEYLEDADGAGHRMVGFVQDITERKQAEEALHDQQAALAHASRVASIGELTSGIVHEISQPLYAVSNFSGACRRTLEGVEFEGSAEVADCLDRITQATTTAQEILVRLRGYLKRQDVQQSMVELSEAIEKVLKLLAFKIRSHGVTVDCDLAPETRVFADPVQLQQVLVNLILNACDALDTVPTEARRILIRAAIVDNEVEVQVEDNGIGISEEAAEHLFDPFFTTKAEGLGVGMAVTKGIISRHDGKIWFTSPPHNGTTFHFTLPVFQEQ